MHKKVDFIKNNQNQREFLYFSHGKTKRKNIALITLQSSSGQLCQKFVIPYFLPEAVTIAHF
jgi:hypothetical protein